MMLNDRFAEFAKNIQLPDDVKQAFQREHTELRDDLHADSALEKYLVDSFLQGSYKRATAVRPVGTKRPDLDIIAVTRIPRRVEPRKAIDTFRPFLEQRYTRVEEQDHSLRVESNGVQIDFVVTAAPTETDETLLKAAFGGHDPIDSPLFLKQFEASLKAASRTNGAWKFKPLEIPDRRMRVWEGTHPLEQIEWTTRKNARCGGHFVGVVRAIKWWRAAQLPPEPKRPKGYPLEHLVGTFCPDGITGLADGLTRTSEAIAAKCQGWAARRETPYLKDHGVDQNVMKQVEGNDFATFYDNVVEAATLAREAHDATNEADSAELWYQLLGPAFPIDEPSPTRRPRRSVGGGFTTPREPARPTNARFA